MSEYYRNPTPTEQYRPTEDEPDLLQRELKIQRGVNDRLDDATKILMLGLAGHETSSYKASLEQLENDRLRQERTRRGMGAFALMETADLSELMSKSDSLESKLDQQKTTLGYQSEYSTAA